MTPQLLPAMETLLAAHRAWQQTNDQLDFDALEDRSDADAAPAEPGWMQTADRSSSASLNHLPVCDHSPGGARANGVDAPATGRTFHDNAAVSQSSWWARETAAEGA